MATLPPPGRWAQLPHSLVLGALRPCSLWAAVSRGVVINANVTSTPQARISVRFLFFLQKRWVLWIVGGCQRLTSLSWSFLDHCWKFNKRKQVLQHLKMFACQNLLGHALKTLCYSGGWPTEVHESYSVSCSSSQSQCHSCCSPSAQLSAHVLLLRLLGFWPAPGSDGPRCWTDARVKQQMKSWLAFFFSLSPNTPPRQEMTL